MVRDSGKDSGKTARLESLHAVDVFEFARNHNEASGVLNLDAMPRMLAEVPVGAPVPQVPFAWRLSGSVTKAPGVDGEREERWLTLAVKGSLWLECQRCLGPYEQALAAETRYLIVDTDAEADARPMDDDEADVVVGSRQFDVVELIEEELLLSLPLVPKHEMCPSVHDSLLTGVDGSESSFDENEAPQESEKPNPFAALKALKGDGSGSNGKGKLKS